MNKKKAPNRAKSKRAAQPARIELGTRMTIVQALDLHRTLLARLASGRPMVVDGSQIEEIDTAVLQLLASLWRTSLARGIPCTWHGASEKLRRTAALIGVAEILQFPDVEPARTQGHAAT